MIAFLALVALAQADPATLRGPSAPFVAKVGRPDVSVAAFGTFAVDARADGGAIGLAVGHDYALTGPCRRLGAARGARRRPRRAADHADRRPRAHAVAGPPRTGPHADTRLSLVIPAVVATTGVHVPVLLEGAAAWRVGRVWLGARAGAGIRLDAGYVPSVGGSIGVSLSGWPLRRGSGVSTRPRAAV